MFHLQEIESANLNRLDIDSCNFTDSTVITAILNPEVL